MSTSYSFSETVGTTAASLGFTGVSTNDGIATLTTDGSGNITNTGANNWEDAIAPFGDSSSHGRIVIPAGQVPYYTAAPQRMIQVRCRSTSIQLGYAAFMAVASGATTSVADQIKFTRNDAFVFNADLSGAPIDMAAVPVDLDLWAEGNNLHVICNGVQYDALGSGGNDANGNPMLTGGRAGFGIHNNGTAGGLISSFDDGFSVTVVLGGAARRKRPVGRGPQMKKSRGAFKRTAGGILVGRQVLLRIFSAVGVPLANTPLTFYTAVDEAGAAIDGPISRTTDASGYVLLTALSKGPGTCQIRVVDPSSTHKSRNVAVVLV